MRVLHVLPSLEQNYGGPLRAVLDLSARALRFGWESEVVGIGKLCVPDNPFPEELIHSVPLGRPTMYRYAPGLAQWMGANLDRFDGVVVHGLWLYPGVVVARMCQRLGKPFACFPHGMLEPWSVFGQGLWKATKKCVYWKLFERKIIERARAVFYTTERERGLAMGTFPVANPSYIVVPYGIDVSVPYAEAPENPKLALPAETRVALFLSRVHPKKNLEFLIDAWAKAQPGPEWRLVIAGPAAPGYVAELRSKIRQLSLERQVSLVGPVAGADKSYLLHRADWFLLPSKQENFGVAVLEAIAAGCPVAISNQVYVADYFHKEAEILPLYMDEWVTYLRERMTNEQHRRKLIRLDHEYTIPRFEINSIARAWAQEMQAVFA